jgi:SAM-dependent methyltransferase
MYDLSAIAANLEQRADGVWHARTHSAVDYPDQGNAFCFQVEDHSFWFRHRNACILEAVRRYPPPGPIFDIGGGNGFVARALQQAGLPAVLVEPGPCGVANAQRRGIAPLVLSTIEDAQFRPGSLPAAGLFDVLEHIRADDALLATLRGLIMPGGRLYLTVPAYRWLWSADDDLGGHHRRYTRRGLAVRLARAGFAVNYATYIFAPLPLPILLLRALPTRLGLRGAGDLQRDVEKIAAELTPGEGLAARAVAALLRVEQRWIERGHTLPSGGSVLMVATIS